LLKENDNFLGFEEETRNRQEKAMLLVACVNSVTLVTAETTLSTFTKKLVTHESSVHQTHPRMIVVTREIAGFSFG